MQISMDRLAAMGLPLHQIQTKGGNMAAVDQISIHDHECFTKQKVPMDIKSGYQFLIITMG